MTKYTKLLSLILFFTIILFGLVLYQSQPQGAAFSLEIVTDEGDESELLATNFSGYAFTQNMTSQAPSFEFEEGEFIFRNERSMIQQLDYQHNPGINRYVREYRSFMRGKARHLSVFTETDEHIYYTAMPSDVNWRSSYDNQVTISRFHKETEEETAFEALLNGGSDQSVVAAYVDYPSLTIVTRSTDNHSNNTWLIYAFDFDQPEEELHPVANINQLIGSSDNIQVGSSKVKTERYIPFRSLVAAEGDDNDYTYVEEYDPHPYYIYDTQSNELKEVPPFDDGDLILLSESDRIITGNNQGEEVTWYEWDFNSETLSELGTTSMMNSTIGRTFDDFYYQAFNQNIHLVNEKIYLTEDTYSETEALSLFQIVSLASLETVFSGHIDTVSDNDNGQVDISIQDISFDPELN